MLKYVTVDIGGRVKRNINIHYLCALIVFIISVILLRDTAVVSFFDNAILLENKNPGYYSYLGNPKVYKSFKQYTDIRAVRDKDDKNLYTSEMGFSIERKSDYSFIISGENISNNPIAIDVSSNGFKLENGTYSISENGTYQISGAVYDETDNLYLQVVIVDALPDGGESVVEVASTRGDNCFEVDNSKHDRYEIRLVIGPRHKIIYNLERIIPVVFDENKEKIPIIPDDSSLCFRELQLVYKYNIAEIDKNNISEINASDWAVFKGNLRLLYREFDWFTIDFKDGTGIQVIKNNINTAIYGSLGGEGRVENIEGKIAFNKGYAALINGSGEEADDSALPYGINGIK